MTKRRMFSQSIVSSDAFLDMSFTAQALYLQLGISADDDGFVNPKRILRMLGAEEKDLNELVDRRFVLLFESGVAVIKHWHINNYLRSDRYNKTTYTEEFKLLKKSENGAYTEIKKTPKKTEMLPSGIPNDIPVGHLEKLREAKVSIVKVNNSTNVELAEKPPEKEYGDPEINSLFEYWHQTVGYKISSDMKKNRNACSSLIKSQGVDNLKRFITWVNLAHVDRYANKQTKIADFIELQHNLKHLMVWAKGKATEKNAVAEF